MNKVFLVAFLLCEMCMSFALAQGQSADSWQGKKLGIFISSRGLSYHPDFHLEVAQFLKLEEDRSNEGRMKSEFIIRLGELLVPQFQEVTGADTVIFLNADLTRGRDFVSAYDTMTSTLQAPSAELKELEDIWVIEPFKLDSRVHNSVFIRSNRMITERIPIKRTRMIISRVDPGREVDTRIQRVCYDDLQKEKPALQFDILMKESKMGKYLSFLFSQWWLQEIGTLEGTCK